MLISCVLVAVSVGKWCFGAVSVVKWCFGAVSVAKWCFGGSKCWQVVYEWWGFSSRCSSTTHCQRTITALHTANVQSLHYTLPMYNHCTTHCQCTMCNHCTTHCQCTMCNHCTIHCQCTMYNHCTADLSTNCILYTAHYSQANWMGYTMRLTSAEGKVVIPAFTEGRFKTER
jgi:hypothetical protein